MVALTWFKIYVISCLLCLSLIGYLRTKPNFYQMPFGLDWLYIVVAFLPLVNSFLVLVAIRGFTLKFLTAIVSKIFKRKL